MAGISNYYWTKLVLKKVLIKNVHLSILTKKLSLLALSIIVISSTILYPIIAWILFSKKRQF